MYTLVEHIFYDDPDGNPIETEEWDRIQYSTSKKAINEAVRIEREKVSFYSARWHKEHVIIPSIHKKIDGIIFVNFKYIPKDILEYWGVNTLHDINSFIYGDKSRYYSEYEIIDLNNLPVR